MERMQIVGRRNVRFQDDDGRQVEGISFYYVMDDERVEGQMTGKFFVGSRRVAGLEYVPSPGDDVVVSYDRYGKPSDFKLVG